MSFLRVGVVVRVDVVDELQFEDGSARAISLGFELPRLLMASRTPSPRYCCTARSCPRALTIVSSSSSR